MRRGDILEDFEAGKNEKGVFSFKRLSRLTFWINGTHALGDLIEEWAGRLRESDWTHMSDIFKTCIGMGMRFVLIGTKLDDIPRDFLKSFEYRFLMTNDENNFMKSGMLYPKEYKDNVIRFKASNEALNRQKPSLYILPQDEKIVKMFEFDAGQNTEDHTGFFEGVGEYDE